MQRLGCAWQKPNQKQDQKQQRRVKDKKFDLKMVFSFFLHAEVPKKEKIMKYSGYYIPAD